MQYRRMGSGIAWFSTQVQNGPLSLCLQTALLFCVTMAEDMKKYLCPFVTTRHLRIKRCSGNF